MAATGYLQIRAFTSFAETPLRDVSVVIMVPDRTVIALRLTDRSGLTDTIEIPTPDQSESQSPGAEEQPYTLIHLYARAPGYAPVSAENLQIFPDTVTYQDLEMVPLTGLPNEEIDPIDYDTPPQDL